MACERVPSFEFPLFNLPPEIRLSIFKAALGPRRILRLMQCPNHDINCSFKTRVPKSKRMKQTDADKFRRTCREAYYEITPLFWTHYSFDVWCYCEVQTILNGKEQEPFRNLRSISFGYGSGDYRFLRRLRLCSNLSDLTLRVDAQAKKSQCLRYNKCLLCGLKGFFLASGRVELGETFRARSVFAELAKLRGLCTFKISPRVAVSRHRNCPHLKAFEKLMVEQVSRPKDEEYLKHAARDLKLLTSWPDREDGTIRTPELSLEYVKSVLSPSHWWSGA